MGTPHSHSEHNHQHVQLHKECMDKKWTGVCWCRPVKLLEAVGELLCNILC